MVIPVPIGMEDHELVLELMGVLVPVLTDTLVQVKNHLLCDHC